jgi:catechol 2,3-dioxygenase-like lactoylglutathione lyase family enzyme
MKCLRAATLAVADLDRSVSLYRDWLDYSLEAEGPLPADLAGSWDAPGAAGARHAVLRPASGADVFLRLVQQEPHPAYRPLNTYGWAAIEICATDVLEVDERMKRSPFEIIGPPREIEGLDAIYPMQVKGPDGEIVYLTQIRSDLPAYDLPRAESLIDRLFILVMACSDMHASLKWFEEHVGFTTGRVMDIEYHMLADAFGTPRDALHTISTAVHERDVFLELDQYPDAAAPRPRHPGWLPPGCAIGSFIHPDFDRVTGDWVTPPAIREGAPYTGRRAGTLRAPDGTLVEIIEA